MNCLHSKVQFKNVSQNMNEKYDILKRLYCIEAFKINVKPD
jgi:hypothetical protein